MSNPFLLLINVMVGIFLCFVLNLLLGGAMTPFAILVIGSGCGALGTVVGLIIGDTL